MTGAAAQPVQRQIADDGIEVVGRLADLGTLLRASREAPQALSNEVLEAIPSETPSAERVLYYRDELRVLEELVSELPERTQIAENHTHGGLPAARLFFDGQG